MATIKETQAAGKKAVVRPTGQLVPLDLSDKWNRKARIKVSVTLERKHRDVPLLDLVCAAGKRLADNVLKKLRKMFRTRTNRPMRESGTIPLGCPRRIARDGPLELT